MTTIPTGPEHINRRARVLTDVKHPNTLEVLYRAGEIVTVKDVRSASAFSAAASSVGYRRVTIQGHPAQRPRSTSANNLELLPEAPKASGVTVTVHNAGGGGGYSSAARNLASGGVVTSSISAARNGLREAQKHADLAAAHECVARALESLRKVEESYR